MKKLYSFCVIFALLFACANSQPVLVYHTIQTDSTGGMIPWYNADPGVSYDHDLQLIWNFWQNVPDTNGTKLYMMDHSYSPTLQGSMIGGDQFAMALSSWSLYYAYTGNTAIISNMTTIANTYLANSLSSSTNAWPNLPYPSNFSNPTLPVYDGDYTSGAGVTEPDKAGSFANELVTLFKITGDSAYLTAAVNIANTLAAKVFPGDSLHPPYPFKVNAQTGSTPPLLPGANYTTDFAPTMLLFESLTAMGQGNTTQYNAAYNTIKTWVQTYPLHNNNWGCFFEDIVGPSNTETNAVTMARFILNHPNWDNTYQQDARSILDWTFNTFQDTLWNQYDATAIFEQSVDLKPGGSHTSRYASTELLYSAVTGDTTRRAEAIRQLNWATYLVDTTGACRFSPSEGSVWYTDGYGDYVRHFLRAMGSYPAIAPYNANHLLQTTSVITNINYGSFQIAYTTYDSASAETLRLTSKPVWVSVDGAIINQESTLNNVGWTWTPYATGGVLNVLHNSGHNVIVSWTPEAINSLAQNNISFNIYPNPALNNVTLSYSLSHAQNVEIEITDMSGQRINNVRNQAVAGLNKQLINTEDLASGIYLVRLVCEDGNLVQKLVVAAK